MVFILLARAVAAVFGISSVSFVVILGYVPVGEVERLYITTVCVRVRVGGCISCVAEINSVVFLCSRYAWEARPHHFFRHGRVAYAVDAMHCCRAGTLLKPPVFAGLLPRSAPL